MGKNKSSSSPYLAANLEMEQFPIYTCSVLPNESKHMFLSWPCLMSAYERVPLMKNQSCAKQPFRARVPQGLFIFSLAISEPVGFQTPEKKQHRVLIDRSIAMKTAASTVS